MIKRYWLILVGALLSFSFATASETPEKSSSTWVPLFDGSSMSGWRRYRSDKPVTGWQAINGELVRVSKAGDLITEQQFSDFELQLEWKVQAGGNSGIFFRADESERYIFLTAPEMQILDDAKHKDGKDPLTSAGANYALHPAPRGIVNPAGEWNHARLRVIGNQVTQWLNHQRIIDYRLGSTDWQQRVAASKFAKWPKYGTLRRGHIGLQDHGDPVAFRNIQIRDLSSE
ncbi:MAG: DUF1080 domain-containing protein [Gammaproteobacteria bacterium TMED92]|nr:MAG: DUF1080 domain-containing protein [Gammaproteobacteria bacterium TMED92]